MKTKLRSILYLTALTLSSARLLVAAGPNQINYQGLLADSNGNPISGNKTISVRLFNTATGGTPIYQESIGSVQIVNGIYSFQFGAAGAGIASVLTGAENYLAVHVDNVEQAPRTKILAVPFAMKSADAQALSGQVGALESDFNSKIATINTNVTAFGGNLSALQNQVQTLASNTTATALHAAQVASQSQLIREVLHQMGLANLEEISPELIPVPGGQFNVTKGMDMFENIPAFEIGKYEVTWKEWKEVREYAVANGYDLENVGAGNSDQHPVQSVSFWDVIKWCNAKSQMEGLTPAFTIDDQPWKSGEVFNIYIPMPEMSGPPPAGMLYFNSSANGYRLPTYNEWTWAALGGEMPEAIVSEGANLSSSEPSSAPSAPSAGGGGASSMPYFSGGSDIGQVAWYAGNSGASSKAVGTKAANQLGLHDMSGNVWEMVLSNMANQVRGGSYAEEKNNFSGLSSYNNWISEPSHLMGFGNTNETGRMSMVGFRLARSLPAESMVNVYGGTLPQSSGLAGQQVASFQIGRYEVTWAEWQEVRDWAVQNGYTDLAGIGEGSAPNHPVRNVSWYDVVKWCNAKSEREGLMPVYLVSGGVYKTGLSDPTVNSNANGYRLPLEKEWEWAARGGVSSHGYTYSGSNDVDAVAWYGMNSSAGTKSVGTKVANELGIHDMSGNVFEWCLDIPENYGAQLLDRRIRQGSWDGISANCQLSNRNHFGGAISRDNNIGFRFARNAP
jgi:formylglycine-generating enzyme required for sulfatase activity